LLIVKFENHLVVPDYTAKSNVLINGTIEMDWTVMNGTRLIRKITNCQFYLLVNVNLTNELINCIVNSVIYK